MVAHVPYDGFAVLDERERDYSSVYEAVHPRHLRDLSDSEIAGLDQTRVSDYSVPKKKKAKNSPKPSVRSSRIRVQLSRPLTWAEKEHLETDWTDPHSRRFNDLKYTGFNLRVADNREHVWVEAPFGSRILFDLVAAAVEQHFVNVFPKAVRTFREYNGAN